MAVKRSAKKKTAKKKAAKAPAKKAKKKASKKKAAAVCRPRRKAAKKKTASAARRIPRKEQPVVEPGPPTVSAPPVEEPTTQEEAVAIVTHYYSHLGVAVVQVNKGALRTGDLVRVKGHTSDFTQTVGSMEYEHRHVDAAEAGQSVGLKVVDHAREHDIVYLVKQR